MEKENAVRKVWTLGGFVSKNFMASLIESVTSFGSIKFPSRTVFHNDEIFPKFA